MGTTVVWIESNYTREISVKEILLQNGSIMKVFQNRNRMTLRLYFYILREWFAIDLDVFNVLVSGSKYRVGIRIRVQSGMDVCVLTSLLLCSYVYDCIGYMIGNEITTEPELGEYVKQMNDMKIINDMKNLLGIRQEDYVNASIDLSHSLTQRRNVTDSFIQRECRRVITAYEKECKKSDPSYVYKMELLYSMRADYIML